jgi:hypothetical protein
VGNAKHCATQVGWSEGMTVLYRRNDAPEALGGQSITCLLCGRTSFHPSDVEMFYCGSCHRFLRDPAAFQHASEAEL